MDGMDVFNFAMRVVPKSIKEICKETETSLEDINHLIFHQANRFMTDFFVKKLKFDMAKVPYSIGKFGNTSSASIPLTLTTEFGGATLNNDKVILAGFGAGLSWGTALLNMNDCKVSPLIEY